MCAARNFALTRSLRGARTNCTSPKSEDLLAVQFYGRLNETLKRRVSFNGEFAERQTLHIIVCALAH